MSAYPLQFILINIPTNVTSSSKQPHYKPLHTGMLTSLWLADGGLHTQIAPTPGVQLQSIKLTDHCRWIQVIQKIWSVKTLICNHENPPIRPFILLNLEIRTEDLGHRSYFVVLNFAHRKKRRGVWVIWLEWFWGTSYLIFKSIDSESLTYQYEYVWGQIH